MAAYMDVDISEGFIQGLTCPICREVFQDPVLLPCSHSFCRACLDKSSQTQFTGNTCPMCRAAFDRNKQPIPNRALNDACESFRKQKPLQQLYARCEGNVCRMHGMEFQLFCMKDEELLCVECVTLHQYHELVPLVVGLPYCKEQVDFKIQILEKKLELNKKAKEKFTSTMGFIEQQAGQTADHIKAEFERLHKVLVTEEAVRMKALEDEKKDKIGAMEYNLWETTENIASLSNIVQTLKRDMGDDDLTFMQNFKELKKRAQWHREDPEFSPAALLSMGNHVGSLSFNIWQNMKTHIKYNPVVLDPNTASPWLDLTPDLTSMKESPVRQSVPDNPERFDPCVFILGSEGFSSGKHRWDIVVGDNPKWIVGACTETVARKKRFTVSTKRGVWCVGLSKGEFTALTPERTKLDIETRVEKIRIKLDMDKGELSFWDGGSLKHLCTFTHQFNEKMFPLFGPGLHDTPMVLASGKVVVHTS